MKKERRSSLQFSLTLTTWAGMSLVAMLLSLSIVLRLDVAFLESQGMVKSPEMREALYLRALNIDPVIWGMLALGLLSVGLVSFLFSRSQFGYFGNLSRILEHYAEKGHIPEAASFGQFTPHVITFLEVAAMRTRGEDEDKVQSVIEVARKSWPVQPKVHWYDQLQFLLVAGILSIFFNLACIVFYLQASEHVVNLASSLVRYSKSEAPYFFIAQFEIVNPLMWSILGIASIAFMVTSFRFGRRFSEATYAILRDLGHFMDGDLDKRLFLRTDDPGRELVTDMNHSLDRIAGQIRARTGNVAGADLAPDSNVTPLRLN